MRRTNTDRRRPGVGERTHGPLEKTISGREREGANGALGLTLGTANLLRYWRKKKAVGGEKGGREGRGEKDLGCHRLLGQLGLENFTGRVEHPTAPPVPERGS